MVRCWGVALNPATRFQRARPYNWQNKTKSYLRMRLLSARLAIKGLLSAGCLQYSVEGIVVTKLLDSGRHSYANTSGDRRERPERRMRAFSWSNGVGSLSSRFTIRLQCRSP